ncbi:Mss4-like protein [Aspergillus crustosus]
MSETKTLTARCHCSTTHFTLPFPSTTLPLQVHLCHCTICRTTHGAHAAFHAPLPAGIAPKFISPSGLHTTTTYKHAAAHSFRHFCTTCGCHIGDRSLDGATWTISISLFDTADSPDENGIGGMWVFNEHIYTASTGDGGLASLLPTINNRELTSWDTERGNEPAIVNEPTNLNTDTDTDTNIDTETDLEDDTLLAECHCGGISFNISRPRPEYLSSPLSKDWMHLSNNKKWQAILDACSDCRLVTGAHVIGWLFVPVDHISPALPETLLLGTSKSYKSSENVNRTFCGTCGATVFYSERSRPGIVDIATGILRGRKGVMVGDWAVWRTARVGYVDDGLKYDEAFTRSLTEGLQEWGRKVDGDVRDFEVWDGNLRAGS